MIKYLFYFFVFLLVASGVKAQVSPTPRQDVRKEVRDIRQDTRKEAQDLRQNTRQEVKDVRQNMRQETGQMKREAVEAVRVKRQETQQLIQVKREEFRKKVDEKKVELRQKVEVKRQELKDRLVKIKDEKKKQAVLRIDQGLDALNEKQLNHFSQVLEKLETVLTNISSRADKAEANGINVAPVRLALEQARNQISLSRSAIEAQSGKTYAMAVTTEENLKTDVKRARQALHDDLNKVKVAVKTAHEAVRKAAVTLAQIPRVDTLEVEESSPNQ
ncbi:hypothetical protein HYV91_03735 [Candidatus Wolfebacteria bacterium]|nr:hypothetical protein [Candidatus Wolfebacteria bacterium]